LEEKFFTSEEQPLCEGCYKEKIFPKCSGCGKMVEGESVMMEGSEEKIFHKECVSCSRCDQPITGKYYVEDQNMVCQACLEKQFGGRTCEICTEDIMGDCLSSRGKNYHKACIKCTICEESLTGKFFCLGEKFMCEKDYKDTRKMCSDCGEEISGPYYTLEDDKVVCAMDFKKRLGNCRKCGEVVEGRIMKISDDMVYHPDCFCCVVCNASVVGEPFSQDEESNIYCSADFIKKTAGVCSSCGEFIVPKEGESTTERIRALGKDFHSECFKCQDCGQVLNSVEDTTPCYPIDGQPYCAECSHNKRS